MSRSIRLEDGLIVGSAAEMIANLGTYQNYWGRVNPGKFDKDWAFCNSGGRGMKISKKKGDRDNVPDNDGRTAAG